MRGVPQQGAPRKRQGREILVLPDFMTSDDLADKIHGCINKRTFGLEANKDDIEKIIKEGIDKYNVRHVLNEYKESHGENMISAIMHDYNIDINKRRECIKYIQNALKERYGEAYESSYDEIFNDIFKEMDTELNYQHRQFYSKGEFIDTLLNQLERREGGLNYYNKEVQGVANGKIDADFAQHNTGDCWLLATIKSIANNPKGKEALENQISVDEFGNATVILKGVNKVYTFTSDELKNARELSSGDMDVRAIEMAVNKYWHETNAHNKGFKPHRDINEGGWGTYALDIIFDKNSNRLDDDDINEDFIDKLKSGNLICTVSAHIAEVPKSAFNKNYDKVDIIKNHAYSVVKCDNDYVYIVNPWNSSETLKMTLDDFKNTFDVACFLDSSELD